MLIEHDPDTGGRAQSSFHGERLEWRDQLAQTTLFCDVNLKFVPKVLHAKRSDQPRQHRLATGPEHVRWLSNSRAPRPGSRWVALYNGTGRLYAGRGNGTSAELGSARSDPFWKYSDSWMCGVACFCSL